MRLFRYVDQVGGGRISNTAYCCQCVWTLAVTLYPLTMAPFVMGWKSRLSFLLTSGQLSFSSFMYACLGYTLPSPGASERASERAITTPSCFGNVYCENLCSCLVYHHIIPLWTVILPVRWRPRAFYFSQVRRCGTSWSSRTALFGQRCPCCGFGSISTAMKISIGIGTSISSGGRSSTSAPSPSSR